MTSVTVLVQHKGRWDATGNYVDYGVDAVVITSDCTFEELISIIANQIRVDTTVNQMEIKYKVDATRPPIEIHNDMGVKVFVEIKKDNKELGRYPLCITVSRNWFDEADNWIVNSPEHVESNNIQSIAEEHTQELIAIPDFGDFEDSTALIIADPMQEEIIEGQVFQDKDTIVKAMKHYALRNKFHFKVKRSSSKCYCLICTGENCAWKFKSSSLNASGLFKIRKFVNEHSCPLKNRIFNHKQATAAIIGSLIQYKYKDLKSTYKPKEIIEDIHKQYGVELPYMKAWRSKEKALETMRGDPIDSYNKLPGYLYILEKTNPGSIVDFVKTEDDCFLYAFVALNASIKGWEYCRPIVVVDGSFLTATHKGTFLAASTMDGAGRILPLAYAIVDYENDDAWHWFFDNFGRAYGQRVDMCIVSDRKESILKAASIVYPMVQHYACIWHLWNNVKSKFKRAEEKLHEAFFTMAKAYTVKEFDKKMEDVAKMDNHIKTYLYNAGYQKWARAHSTVRPGWIMTSNIAESLNAATKGARNMPVSSFMESMRAKVEMWNNRNREGAENTFTKLGKKFNDILDKHRTLALQMTVKPSSGDSYSVWHKETKFLVSLRDRTCCCSRFQMDELPCAHAVSVMKSKSMEEEIYASPYYTKQFLLKTYEVPVNHIPDESNWDIPPYITDEVVHPPIWKRTPGRPKKTRYKQPWELHPKRSKITCGLCGCEGHNRATCTNLPKRN